MSDSADWPALLVAYRSALEEFERITTAMTLLLIDRTSTPEDFRGIFEAEAKARDMVVLTRMRLMNAWREDQPQKDLVALFASDPTKHA